MADSLFEGLTRAVGQALGQEVEENANYRPDVETSIAPDEPIAAELPPIEQEVAPVSEPAIETFGYQLPDFGEIDFDIGSDDFAVTTPSAEELGKRREDITTEDARSMYMEGTMAAQTDEETAQNDYLTRIRTLENADQKGKKGNKFYPIESLEGTGPDGDVFSDKELGYGIKVMKEWLEDDPKGWPMIDGVPVNVQDGITEQQARSLTQSAIDKARESASKKIPKYDDMTAYEKQYWTDLTYNGGTAISKRNPKAMKAAEAGYSGEAMIKTFDYIKAGGSKTRGLLNRRLNMFNEASSEISGLPVVEEYQWGEDGVKIKFASKIESDKVSKKFRDKINKAEGWYTVGKGGAEGTTQTHKLNDQYEFN